MGCGLIIGTSPELPIKKGAVETIGAATASGKGKDVRPKKTKTVDVEESTEGVKTCHETKEEKLGSLRHIWYPRKTRRSGNLWLQEPGRRPR